MPAGCTDASAIRVNLFTHMTACDGLARNLLCLCHLPDLRSTTLLGVSMLTDSQQRKSGASEHACAADLLRHTPIEQLDRTVQDLKQLCSAAEVRQAMMEVFARIPLAQFGEVKDVYLRHCADVRR